MYDNSTSTLESNNVQDAIHELASKYLDVETCSEGYLCYEKFGAYEMLSGSAVSDASINFGAISSASNGRGIYLLNSTGTNTYPIYYYRGKVNNYVLFANFC